MIKDEEEETQFAIVFAAMGVNMETAHFFKQVRGQAVCGAVLPPGTLQGRRQALRQTPRSPSRPGTPRPASPAPISPPPPPPLLAGL
jgi:hypothetical protein